VTDPRLTLPWRRGRKVGRTIYARLGDEPSDADVLIGMLDTPELAREAVDAHNRARSSAEASEQEIEDAIYDYTFKACRDQGLGSATSSTIANRVVERWGQDA
jgi:hypothetical protein